VNFTLPMASSSDAVNSKYGGWTQGTETSTHWDGASAARLLVCRFLACATVSVGEVRCTGECTLGTASHCLSCVVQTQEQNFGILVEQAW
jgi:hypothetical protein